MRNEERQTPMMMAATVQRRRWPDEWGEHETTSLEHARILEDLPCWKHHAADAATAEAHSYRLTAHY
jgi:hypothetical protein